MSDTNNNEEKHELKTGYHANDKGWWYVTVPTTDDEPVWTWLCPMFGITSRSQDDDGRWGKVLEWRDPDGNEVKWILDDGHLGGDPKSIWAAMYERGFGINTDPKARALLLRFLNEENPAQRSRVVKKLGWCGDAYLLPDQTFLREGEEAFDYVYDGTEKNPYSISGTLVEWRENIAKLAIRNSRMTLALSMAFASPLLEPSGEQSSGVNTYGDSSQGKSKLGELYSSTGGKPDQITKQWRATANGLEGTCAQRSDGLLCLDELGQITAKEAGEVIYMISNGQAKARMNRNTSVRTAKSWRVMFLSNGELTLSQKMEEAKIKIKAGQEIRLIDITADAGRGMGVFEDLHGVTDDPGEFAEHITAQCNKYHGTAFPEFLRRVVQIPRAELVKRLETARADFIRDHVPANASGQVRRPAGRFGIIAAGGELATEFGITGWARGDATKAAATCFRGWLDQRGTLGNHDTEMGVRHVLAYIERHGSAQFEELGVSDDYQPIVQNRAGWRKYIPTEGRYEYLVMPSAFEEMCAGYSAAKVVDELVVRGILLPQSGRNDANRKCGREGQKRVYVLRTGEILTPEQRRQDTINGFMDDATASPVIFDTMSCH